MRVLIAGGGVAALESALALADLAGERVEMTLLAPNSEFIYRPLTVREPFAQGPANRYPLARVAHDAGAQLRADGLEWVDPLARIAHTATGEQIEYDALVLATGALARPRFKHALTIDDRRMDELLHGLIQDVEGGYVRSIAFVAPGRMAWPLPIYELALMTAGRAYDTSSELAVTIVTPEDSPLAIFGNAVSEEVARLLGAARIEVLTSAYAEVPRSGQLLINPGARTMAIDRIVALPELYGPQVRGIPLGEHGFIRVDRFGQVPGVGPIWAAGDATDFAVKYGGIAAQQADAVAESIAALAGAPVAPQPFHPVIHGVLFTDAQPRYLTARITGGHGFSSEISDTPNWSPPAKIAARYLAPYLESRDRETERASAPGERRGGGEGQTAHDARPDGEPRTVDNARSGNDERTVGETSNADRETAGDRGGGG
jgi:sulfide:quinone oxidoreductase